MQGHVLILVEPIFRKDNLYGSCSERKLLLPFSFLIGLVFLLFTGWVLRTRGDCQQHVLIQETAVAMTSRLRASPAFKPFRRVFTASVPSPAASGSVARASDMIEDLAQRIEILSPAVATCAPMRILSFNVLAPSLPYKIRKPLDRVSWRDRHEAICDAIIKMDADIVCIQEFDFASTSNGFKELYLSKLGHIFDFYFKRRTGISKEGLAILLRRGAFENVEVEHFDLSPWMSRRVAILTKMRHTASNRRIAVMNTHLSVASADDNRCIPMDRPEQMQQVLRHLREALEGHAGGQFFLCGDMNCDHLENESTGSFEAALVNRPLAMVFEQGFASALHTAHPGKRPMTHTCSYAREGCVDYIFFKPSEKVALENSFLYPEYVPLDAEWDDHAGWDRESLPLLQTTLSDHRPLVADFQLKISQQKPANRPRTSSFKAAYAAKSRDSEVASGS